MSFAIQSFFSLLVISAFLFSSLENHVHDQPTWSSMEVVDGSCDIRESLHLCPVPTRRSMTPCLACLPHPKGDSLSIDLVEVLTPPEGFGIAWPAIDAVTTRAESSSTPVRGPPSA